MPTLHKQRSNKALSWLPINERLIPPIFTFQRVSGLSRVFLEIELALSVFVVLGTLLIVLLKVFT